MAKELTGQEILGYRIAELIGEGGMATVWRAEHTTLESTVAIKVLDPLLAQDGDLVQRFVDEAKIQHKLRHPNIVGLENFSQDPLAMVMEYVEGSSLSDMIGLQVGPIPLERALPMMRQIMDAVGHAHAHGVVHRDLKPANVMVTADGRMMVTDFGIAKILSSTQGRTRTGMSMGTPAYMAPEQIRGAKDVDARADIYALGVTFYEMLAGRTPFWGADDEESDYGLMDAQVRKPPPDPREFYPHIPERVVELLLRTLSKEPVGRPSSVEELRAALDAAAGGAAPARTVVESGPAVPAPARTVVESGPAMPSGPADVIPAKPLPGKSNIALIAAVVGVLVVAVAVLVGWVAWDSISGGKSGDIVQPTVDDDDDESEEQTTPPAEESKPAPPAPVQVAGPTPARPHVVIVKSVKIEKGRGSADRYAAELRNQGYPDAMVLDGRNYAFRCCYWVVIIGVFADRSPANALTRAAKGDGLPIAYPRRAFKE